MENHASHFRNRQKNIPAIILINCLLIYLVIQGVSCQNSDSKKSLSVEIDGAERFQQIHGFGVSVNPEIWNNTELLPALDILTDSMNFIICKVNVEMGSGFEDLNDNGDPFNMNWNYYNKLYETPKFQKIWNTLEHLNKHAIMYGLFVDFTGAVPEWMGKNKISPEYEDEFVEMELSFLMYAWRVRKLYFAYFTPLNLADTQDEGLSIDAHQLTRLMRKLADRIDKAELQFSLIEPKMVVPDISSTKNGTIKFIAEILADSVIMAKVAHANLDHTGFSPGTESNHLSAYWQPSLTSGYNGPDNGKMTGPKYKSTGECVNNLFQLLKNGSYAVIWEGFSNPYEHPHSESDHDGLMSYDETTRSFSPKEQLYTISQITKNVFPGSYRIGTSDPGKDLELLSFHDPYSGRFTITGSNKTSSTINLKGFLKNLPSISYLEMVYTDSLNVLPKSGDISVNGNMLTAYIPGNSIYSISGITSTVTTVTIASQRPEPSGWYAGDPHVHRYNCNKIFSFIPETDLITLMEGADLAVISVSADVGNGEGVGFEVDLPKVNGTDAPQSKPGRIVHYDAEWHFDPVGNVVGNKALGGHLILLGLKEAHVIWDESAYKILEWGRKQDAIRGFVHMQYLDDTIVNELSCCTPIEYPVETALGTIDFLMEDHWPNDAAINAYYKILNCGFRPGWCAGTDGPCLRPLGSVLTYVDIKDQPLTYRRWIEGIKNGRTVVATNGHTEFLDLKVSNDFGPGDEVAIKDEGTVNVNVVWTAIVELSGRIELVCNGKVVATSGRYFQARRACNS
ncbi:MAG: CehA/McbA family metallohydrolase [Bacteroidales bacterium]|nr:CehA/McbA family metallohydrolase [Bacteroidales bacterium]